MKKRIFFIWFCLCAYLFAANPICSNSEQDEIYRTKCYSFGDEFVYIYQEWPEYDNGDEKPEEGITCFDKFKYSESQEVERFTRNGIQYGRVSLEQYCCNHQVFRTSETRWGNDVNGYIDFSDYGNYGVFYSSCNYQETEQIDTVFMETSLQQPIDGVEFLNFSIKMFDSGKSDMMKMFALAALADNGEMLFKIYRSNGTIKYMGGIHLGFCFSKNGKKVLNLVKGPKHCK